VLLDHLGEAADAADAAAGATAGLARSERWPGTSVLPGLRRITSPSARPPRKAGKRQ
jgi:hypothetical protein